jgi:hypothetical protein
MNDELGRGAQDIVRRRTEFLAEKMPRTPPGVGGLGRSQSWNPPRVEMDRFNRMSMAAEDPVSSLERMNEGKLTPGEVEAFRSVYPEFYKDVQSRLLEAMSDQKDIPQWKRLQVSMFLDAAVDGSMAPHVIRMSQQMHQNSQKDGEKGQAGMPGPPTNLGAATEPTKGQQRSLKRE